MEEKNKTENKMKNMTEGNPLKLIFMFAIPLLLGNLFQQLYNMVDSIVVGNYVGKVALAAVGTGFPLIFLMVSMFMGVGMGSTILISQYYGAGDIDSVTKTSKTIYTAMILGSIPISVIGIFITGPILGLINTPLDTLPMAKDYMVIVFAGILGSIGFNINAGILQGIGDSRSSLLFLAIACSINVVLDLIFVLNFGLGVSGVAYATIIAQFSSWIFGIYYMRKKYEFLYFPIFKFEVDKNILKKILKLGFPTGVQQTLFSIGIMGLQSLVNSYGSDFMAGFNVANKVDMISFMPIMSFSTAITTYVGQNIGAGRLDRVHKGFVYTAFLSAAFCILSALIVLPFGEEIMGFFNKDEAVIQAGMVYLKSVLPFYLILAIVFTLNGVIRGAGETIIPMIGSFIALWIGRIPIAYILSKVAGRDYIFYSYAIGWVLWLIVSWSYYMSGKWKNKSLHLIRDNLQ